MAEVDTLVMIATRFRRQNDSQHVAATKGRCMMESLTSGTIAGAGSFRCQRCGYVLTLAACDMLTDCPGCGGRSFVRASLFSTGADATAM